MVVDKFHVLMHVHQAQTQKSRRGQLFHARYLLFTVMERLTPERYNHLTQILAQYPLLQRTWTLKEAFKAWYRSTSRAEAERGLTPSEDSVRELGPQPFGGLLSMLQTWHKEILNYFDYPYANGFLEARTTASR
jgi:transposase